MLNSTPYILFFAANFAFIITNLYGWLLNTYYKPKIHKKDVNELYPSRKSTNALYILQLFEIPYLINIGDTQALFYVNTFSILIFPALMTIMGREYFLMQKKTPIQLFIYFAPVAVVVFYLLFASIHLVPSSHAVYYHIFWLVLALYCFYMLKVITLQITLRTKIRKYNEQEYSNSEDFPVKYAEAIKLVPAIISIVMLLSFLMENVWVKMARDIIFTVVNVWFMISTLIPHRNIQKKINSQISADTTNKYRVSQERCDLIERQIIELITNEKLFLDEHLTSESISKKLGINRNYISEVIGRSKYGSFYNLVNNFRIEYACQMMKKDPNIKIGYIAIESGFSSNSIFSQTFKKHKGISPSQFLSKNS